MRVDFLERAGTSKDYSGLWRDVSKFQPLSADAELPVLVEIAKVESIVELMAGIDRHFDHLKASGGLKGNSTSDHGEIVLAHEALLVKEGLSEVARQIADKYDDQFKQWIVAAEATAEELSQAFKEQQLEKAHESFAVLEKSCKQCHKKYRDN